MHFTLYLLELLSSGPVRRSPEAPLAEMYGIHSYVYISV